MAQRYCDPRWIIRNDLAAIHHLRGGFYEEGALLTEDDVDCVIPFRDLYSLVGFLDEQGFIKPRLDERLRDEDLKITHRVLDLLDKSISS